MAQFHVLTGLAGGAVALESNIDNVCGHKRVGLREITYVTGWYNISAALGNNVFSIRATNDEAPTNVTVPDGYYNVDTLKAVVSAAMPGLSAKVNHATGRVVLTLTDANYRLNLASTTAIWGFRFLVDDAGEGSGDPMGQWKGAGTYISDSTPGFFNNRNLHVHLDHINTTGNVLNGRQSTLLRIIPTSGESYGESRTVTFENPQFRRLRSGSIQQLTVRILDDQGNDISTFAQMFCVTLEVVDKHKKMSLWGPGYFSNRSASGYGPSPPWNASGLRIKNVGDPEDDSGAATKTLS